MKTSFASILLLLVLISCTSSSDKPSTTHFSGNAMTIDYRITIGSALSLEEQTKVRTIIRQTFNEVNDIYNKWNPNSELSKLNSLKAHQIAPLSPQLEYCLLLAQEIVALSKGRFDPTVEPLQNLWKQKLQRNTTPSSEEIALVTPALGWDKIHFGQGQFSKDHDSTSIDLSAIAKGLCVDFLVERLLAAKYPDLFVEWGGEVRASGQHPSKRPWHLFISRFEDRNPDNAIAHLDLQDQAIATSGDYLQQWTVDGITYFHIFDLQTGFPLISKDDNIASASVVARTCAFADGLATTAMLLSPEEAQIWAEEIEAQFPGVHFLLTTKLTN